MQVQKYNCWQSNQTSYSCQRAAATSPSCYLIRPQFQLSSRIRHGNSRLTFCHPYPGKVSGNSIPSKHTWSFFCEAKPFPLRNYNMPNFFKKSAALIKKIDQEKYHNAILDLSTDRKTAVRLAVREGLLQASRL